MFGIISKLSKAIENRTTYRIGILQDKAYRVLKLHTNTFLSQKKITSVHWAMLGLLYDHPRGLRMSSIATELGVEASFITVVYKELLSFGWLDLRPDTNDSRAKLLRLTASGISFVDTTESALRSAMQPLLSGTSVSDIIGYMTVLQTIINNSKNINKN